MKVYILMGVQGAGKGTQAAKLSKKLKIPALSVGEMFRKEVAAGTPLGQLIGFFINHGHLVPSAITNRLVRKTLAETAYKRGVILDGYPRNWLQARYLWRRVPEAVVISLDIPDSESLRRLLGRRVCPKDGTNYHIKFLPPKRPGYCDKDGARLKKRKDDNVKAIKARIKIFHKETKPLLKFYRRRGRLIEVSGNASPETVFREMIKKIKVRSE